MHNAWAGNQAFDRTYGSSWALASPPLTPPLPPAPPPPPPPLSPSPPDATTAGAGVPPQPQSPCTCAQANAFLRSYASSNTDGCTVTTQNCGSADFSTWSCSYKSDRSPQYEWTCTDAKALNAGASNVETGSDSSSMGPIIGGAGEQTAPPCNLARALARRPHGLHPAPPPRPSSAHSWRRGGRWRTGRRRRLRQDEGEESTRRRPSAGRRDPVCARPERGREQDLKKRRARSSCERACARGQTISQRRPPSARGRRGQGQLRMHTGKPGRAPGCGETSHRKAAVRARGG